VRGKKKQLPAKKETMSREKRRKKVLKESPGTGPQGILEFSFRRRR
jgi:hypothetical protein